jgi:putative transposase
MSRCCSICISRRIVGWAIRPTLETELVCAAWHMAWARRQPPRGLVHHSDRGCQYTSTAYQALLRAAAVTCSMSRRGNCFDNAPVESFFRTLKVEIAEVCYWPTRRLATQAIAEHIEGFYNTERLHSSLDYQSPATFEARRVAA